LKNKDREAMIQEKREELVRWATENGFLTPGKRLVFAIVTEANPGSKGKPPLDMTVEEFFSEERFALAGRSPTYYRARILNGFRRHWRYQLKIGDPEKADGFAPSADPIMTVRYLVGCTEDRIGRIDGFGKASLRAVKQLLASVGLSLEPGLDYGLEGQQCQ